MSTAALRWDGLVYDGEAVGVGVDVVWFAGETVVLTGVGEGLAGASGLLAMVYGLLALASGARSSMEYRPGDGVAVRGDERGR